MSDFENFLDSLDMSTTEETPQESESTEAESSSQVNQLSEQDFNDILSAVGFQGATEEVQEEAVVDTDDGIDNASITWQETPNHEDMVDTADTLLHTGDTRAYEFQQVFQADTAANAVAHPENTLESHSIDQDTTGTSEATVEELLITPNSPTLLIDDSTSRFSGTEWYNEIRKQRIILAGLGGIGSWVALQLARMSPDTLLLYDDDIVEIANMSGQLYGGEDVGMAKVDAIARTIHNYTTTQNVYALKQQFTADTEAGDIMICGFDNMVARNIFFESWVRHIENKPEEERKKCLYIDGRLSIDTLQVLCIRGDDKYSISTYRERFLFSDEEADHTICSMKQTTYLACMIGSFIVNLFTNHVADLLNPVLPYDLPFFTEYDSQNMIFKTVN